MTVLQYSRFLLFPFALIYGLIIYVRNLLYDQGIFKSIEFDFPVISVGNLSFGGTGKTPHIEYLIRLLSERFKIAMISRGYKRKTTGYILADQNTDAEHIGDEPAQIKMKFPHVAVAVAESREMAIPQILSSHRGTDVILLDDAFQHRSVQPGLSIVLTRFSKLFTKDFILPVGTLREFRGSYKRADFVIVTKCPRDLTDQQKKKIVEEINPGSRQLVLFSYIEYFPAYSFFDSTNRITPDKELDVFLLSGIAFEQDLKDDLEKTVRNLYSMTFSDHYYFDRYDIDNLTDAFNNIESDNKVIFTTEKDAVRLYKHKQWIIDKKLPIYILPIKVNFFEQDKKLFDSEIVGYLEKLRRYKTA